MPVHQRDADHIHRWLRAAPDAARPPLAGLLLDRDGVLIEFVDYLHRVEEVRLTAGAGAAIGRLNRAGVPVAVVTNQAGIARGYYGWAEFDAVEAEIARQLAGHGAWLDAVYACPHHADGQGPFRHEDHPDRKPNPGMLRRAARDLRLDLAHSWLIGDHESDIEAARRAGLAGAVHVDSGYGREHRAAVEALARSGAVCVRFAPGLAEAIALLLPELERAGRG
ncbi:MAG: HAD-IIIA family hydrolase [Phycisphaerae bacterium]